MNKIFFSSKLAAGNIKKNNKIYIPYIITSVAITSMFYMICSLAANSGISELHGGDMIQQTMRLGTYVVGIFSIIFLFYTNNFLMKRREKEFGLYNVLGMGKNHISTIVCFETIYIYGISIVLGIILGVLLDKIFYLIILKILNYDVVLGFYISTTAIFKTIILFALIYILISLNSIIKIKRSSAVELVKSENVGEKEPKTKKLIAIIGIITLGAGYYIAVSIENAIDSLIFFFVAVILVIIGTYLLFTAGSILILKLLRKNKNFYYKTKNFIGVSNMLYRMKRNAVGLSNICILSTMVLVMISSTSSLMIGSEDIIKSHFPNTIGITSESKTDNWEQTTEKIIEKDKLKIAAKEKSQYLNFTVSNNNGIFKPVKNNNDMGQQDATVLTILTLDQYNNSYHKDKNLKKNEVIILEEEQKYKFPYINILNNNFTIKDIDKADSKEKTSEMVGIDSYTVVVKNQNILKNIEKSNIDFYGKNASHITYYVGYNINANNNKLLSNYNHIEKALYNDNFHGRLASQAEARKSFIGSYGSIFFLAVFLGILFTLAMILIIYYKQISEGYEDKKGFEIMQNVGLRESDIKDSIKSQILIVFFLPLVTAGIHVAFAFNMIKRILLLFGLSNTGLYILCTVISFIVFSIMYAIIYTITAKIYYKIVKKS